MEGESYFASPEFFSITLYVLAFVSTPLYFFGGYCILYQSPDAMKSVKWSIFNLHFWGSWTDISVSLLTQPYFLKSTWAIITYGILSKIGVSRLFQSYLVATLLCVVAASILVVFENRLFVLFAEKTWWRYARYPFLIFNYILSISYYIPTILGTPDQVIAREAIFNEFPEFKVLDSPDNPIAVVAYKDPWLSIRQIIWELTITFECLSVVGVLKYNMDRAVKEINVSASTTKLQQAFLRALYIQVFTPLLVIFLPSLISMALPALSISVQSLNSFAYISFACHGFVATIIMLIVQKPYREFCLSFVKKNRNNRETTI